MEELLRVFTELSSWPLPLYLFVFTDTLFISASEELLYTSTSVSVSVAFEPLSDSTPYEMKGFNLEMILITKGNILIIIVLKNSLPVFSEEALEFGGNAK